MKRIVIGFFIFVFFGVWFVGSRIMIRNAFDEMYYAHEGTTNIPWTFASYDNAQLYRFGHLDGDSYRFPKEGVFRENYVGDNFLKSNELIKIQGNTIEQTLSFICRVGYGIYASKEESEGTGIWFEYTYDIEKKTLTMKPLYLQKYQLEQGTSFIYDAEIVAEFLASKEVTREEIEEWNDYFLYQKVLADWFRANGMSRFSMRNLGNMEIIDNQFPDVWVDDRTGKAIDYD